MTRDDEPSKLKEGIEAAERWDVAGREDVLDDISDEPDIVRLSAEQIEDMSMVEVNLILRLIRGKDVPVDSIRDRTLEWLVDLGVITVDDGQAGLKPDRVVFEPIGSADDVDED